MFAFGKKKKKIVTPSPNLRKICKSASFTDLAFEGTAREFKSEKEQPNEPTTEKKNPQVEICLC